MNIIKIYIKQGCCLTGMLSLVIFSVLFNPGCRTKATVSDNPPLIEPDKLHKFFNTCRKDIISAVGVVADNDIIKSLTHLQRMDAGGKKYYLLERESLTGMILSVTEGTYTDLILINRHGIIVYTMTNDEIFGKDVNSTLIGSALYNCYIKTGEETLHVEDITVFPPVIGGLNLFISMRNREDEQSRDVFIMQIDIRIIEKLLMGNEFILDKEGNYRVTRARERIFTSCPVFERIDINGLYVNEKRTCVYDGERYIYSPFAFEDLFWIIITNGGIL